MQHSYFSVILGSLKKQCILFKIFLQFPTKTNGTPSLEKLQVETTKDTHADAEKMLDCNIWIYKSRLSGSVHKLYRLKVLFTLEKVNTSVVEKKKSLNEQNFDVEDLELRYQICYKPFHLKNLFLKWLRILQNKITKAYQARAEIAENWYLRCHHFHT